LTSDLGRIDAAHAHRLPVGAHRPGHELVEAEETVALGLWVGRLARDHRDVVVEALVPDAVVLAQELAAGGQRLREVRGLAVRPEGVVEVLVLQDDHEDVLDRRQIGARRRREGEHEQSGDEESAHRAGR
jgi:hypothetical protein